MSTTTDKLDNSTDVSNTTPDMEEDADTEVNELVSKHKPPITRQIEEAVRINQTFSKRTITTNSGEVKSVLPLNRKGEHFCPRSRSDFFI